MAIYMKLGAVGSVVGCTEASVVHGMHLGSHPLTPANLSHGVEVQAFSFGVQAPRDSQSGSVSGKRQHQPLVVVKEIGKTSPLLLQSCVNNEQFHSLNIQLYTSIPKPKGTPALIIQLTNAAVAGVKRAPHTASRDTYELEEIEFTFQKIEISQNDGKVSMKDDWTQ